MRGTALPLGMRDAQLLVESGCMITPDILDEMPVELFERIVMYREMVAAKLAGD